MCSRNTECGIGSHGAGVTGSWELLSVGCWELNRNLCKSSKCSSCYAPAPIRCFKVLCFWTMEVEGTFTIFLCSGHQIVTSKIPDSMLVRETVHSSWCALFCCEIPTHLEFYNGGISESVHYMCLQYLSKFTMDFHHGQIS